MNENNKNLVQQQKEDDFKVALELANQQVEGIEINFFVKI